MEKTVLATFIGKDGSLGFRQKQPYILSISMTVNKPQITIETSNKKIKCVYTNFLTFLDNWNDIKTQVDF